MFKLLDLLLVRTYACINHNSKVLTCVPNDRNLILNDSNSNILISSSALTHNLKAVSYDAVFTLHDLLLVGAS